MKRPSIPTIVGISCYVLFLIVSWVVGFDQGKDISRNFVSFARDMFSILPCAFILIGLFEVWVKRQTIEKHLGEESGVKGYIWGLLLASTTLGGMYVAFPVAYALYSKGAKLGVIFTYIGASALCRIPMAIFEASFLGIKFTAIRLLVSLPLVVVSSMLLGKYLSKRTFRIMDGQ